MRTVAARVVLPPPSGHQYGQCKPLTRSTNAQSFTPGPGSPTHSLRHECVLLSDNVIPNLLLLLGILLALIVWISLIQHLNERRLANCRPTWDALFFVFLGRFVVRVLQRARYEGLEHIPQTRRGPLIVISNHTSGLDPTLIQVYCPFEIRWMMLREMNVRIVRFFTWYLRTILVESQGKDFASAREALRHIEAGGVIGIFPEGAIERPPCRLLPFQPGVGFLARKAKVSILPVLITGTPQGASTLQWLTRPGNATVRFFPLIEVDITKSPGDIAADLQRFYLNVTLWPLGSHSS